MTPSALKGVCGRNLSHESTAECLDNDGVVFCEDCGLGDKRVRSAQSKYATQWRRYGLLFWAAIAGSLFAFASAADRPPLNPDLIAARWPAFWITSPTAPARSPGVFYFRKEITVPAVPAHFWVHVTADNRFLLHVNGKYVAEGPARGDLFHWRFETVDLAPYLQPGSNVLAATVWNFAELAPVAQMSDRTGFLMQGDTKAESAVNTGKAWRVRQENGRAAIGHDGIRGYYAAGPAERIDGRVLDWAWDQPELKSPVWEEPRLLGPGAAREAQDAPNHWELMQDPLPPMEHRRVEAGSIVRADGLASMPQFPAAPLDIPGELSCHTASRQSRSSDGLSRVDDERRARF